MTRRRESSLCSAVVLLLLFFSLNVFAAAARQGAAPAPPQDRSRANAAKESWAPPEVAASTLAASDPECPMAALVKGASDRVHELAENLLRFTATEDVVHTEWNPSRGWSKPQRVRFDYVAEIEKLDFGGLRMSETRDGDKSLQRFPGGLATLGLPAMVLVFDPIYAGDFVMTCEGRSDWQGRPAWVVYFQQRPEKQSRMRAYISRGSEYLLRLKGRAWLDPASFQVLHLETDLLEPVPKIFLFRDHVAVDYEPVRFQSQDEQLWLQKRADVYLDFRGRRYHRTHEFSQFLLFSVDVKSKDSPPAPQ